MSKKRQPTKVRGRTRREKNNREMRQRFLIVCEGEKTEPAYFKAFQAPGLVVEVCPVGKDPLTLVQEAKSNRSGGGVEGRKPLTPPHPLTRRDGLWLIAMSSILVHFLNVYAISNQSFELWYVLHFQFLCTAISRQDYVQRLEKLLNSHYTKNDPDMYKKLESRQQEALQNARHLLEQYSSWDPVSSDPSTTVHHLVEELKKHKRP